MKVSFLVTYYNQEEYVRESMDSILAIDKPCDWEILVGDDGSRDGTVRIIREYIEKYPDNIKLFIMPRDNGKKYYSVKRASMNRINLLCQVSGDVFCTLDGDDYFVDRDFIKEAVEILKEKPDISSVAFGYEKVMDGKVLETTTLESKFQGRVDSKLYLRTAYIPAGACVHRFDWESGRCEYIKNIGYFDDNDILINSLNYGDMYVINRPIYAYRQREESVFNSMSMAEQALLNVLGYDVDLQLISPDYEEILQERNIEPILTLFFLRKRIRKIVSDEKLKLFMDNCVDGEKSLTAAILGYDGLELDKRRKIDHIIEKLRKMHLKTFYKIRIKCLANAEHE